MRFLVSLNGFPIISITRTFKQYKFPKPLLIIFFMSVFTKDAGRFLAPQETKSMTGAYRERKVAAGISEDEYVRSEYFGINQVMHLLSQPGCIGLRVHHA